MTDDLVKRLREPVWDHFFGFVSEPIKLEAADRIKHLEPALEYYAKNHYPNVDDGPWGINSNDWGDVARAALEEKKDE